MYSGLCWNSQGCFAGSRSLGYDGWSIGHAPSKPSRPVATRGRDIHTTVKWTEPEDDGGADVTGYVIKYGDRGTDVDKYDELSVEGNTTDFQFTHQLNARTSYRFAVAAVNAAGRRGEFSEFTDYVDTGLREYC